MSFDIQKIVALAGASLQAACVGRIDDWSFEWHTELACSETNVKPTNGPITDNAGRLGWWMLPISLIFLCVFGAGLVVAVRRHRKLRMNDLSSSLRGVGEGRETLDAAAAVAVDSAEFMR